MAKPNAEQAKAPDGKPASRPDAKDDLKSLPLPEVEKRLGTTPDGLSQAEATKRLEKLRIPTKAATYSNLIAATFPT